jgi:hypothetical protein
MIPDVNPTQCTEVPGNLCLCTGFCILFVSVLEALGTHDAPDGETNCAIVIFNSVASEKMSSRSNKDSLVIEIEYLCVKDRSQKKSAFFDLVRG